MKLREEQLLNILKIGHDVSMRGEGVSLNDALTQTGYTGLRPFFTVKDIQKIIDAKPELSVQWQAYSEDKRTSGGWYITEKNVVGNLDGQQDQFRSKSEAVAVYVLRELDYWANK